MDKEELRARSICADTNWVKECEDCPHREWPSGKWHKKPRWNYLECEEWKYYLRKPYEKFIRKIRRIIRLHKWFIEIQYRGLLHNPIRIIRTCTICEKKQEYKSNKDYTKGKWVNIV